MAERGEELQVDGDQVRVVAVHGLLLVVVALVDEGALRRELGDRRPCLDDRLPDLVGGVVGGDVGEGLEAGDRFVGEPALLAQCVGDTSVPGQSLGAEPPFLLQVVVDDVGRLAGLLGQLPLGCLPLEVEQSLTTGDGPEGGQCYTGDDGQDEQGRPQRHCGRVAPP